MLIQFNFKNFRSFKGEVSLDMTATKITEHPAHVVESGGDKLLSVAAIYGANASGKSNVYGAFSFMKDYVENSFYFGGNSGSSNNQFDFNPANMINDMLAFFKKPAVTIQQIIGWAGALLLLISTFLPNYKYSVSSIIKVSVGGNLWETRHAIYNILLLLFVLCAIFFIIIKKHIGVIAAGGLIFIWWIIDIASKGSIFTTGIGLWLFFLSSLAIIAAGVWGFLESKK